MAGPPSLTRAGWERSKPSWTLTVHSQCLAPRSYSHFLKTAGDRFTDVTLLTHGRQKDNQIRGIRSRQVRRKHHSPNSDSWTKASIPWELMKPLLTKVSIL